MINQVLLIVMSITKVLELISHQVIFDVQRCMKQAECPVSG